MSTAISALMTLLAPLDNWYDYLHWTSKCYRPIQLKGDSRLLLAFCSNVYGKSHLFHKKVYSTKSICPLFEKKYIHIHIQPAPRILSHNDISNFKQKRFTISTSFPLFPYWIEPSGAGRTPLLGLPPA